MPTIEETNNALVDLQEKLETLDKAADLIKGAQDATKSSITAVDKIIEENKKNGDEYQVIYQNTEKFIEDTEKKVKKIIDSEKKLSTSAKGIINALEKTDLDTKLKSIDDRLNTSDKNLANLSSDLKDQIKLVNKETNELKELVIKETNQLKAIIFVISVLSFLAIFAIIN